MFGECDDDPLREGILRFRAGERAGAQRFLEGARTMSNDAEPRAQAACYLSQITKDITEKPRLLEECLANNLPIPRPVARRRS